MLTEQLRSFDPGAIPDKPLLHVANQVLVIGELQPRREYLDAVARWYDAEIGRAPLAEAKASLDAWAALHTGGLIRQSGIGVGPHTRASWCRTPSCSPPAGQFPSRPGTRWRGRHSPAPTARPPGPTS